MKKRRMQCQLSAGSERKIILPLYFMLMKLFSNERVDPNMAVKIKIETASNMYQYCLLLDHFITMFAWGGEINDYLFINHDIFAILHDIVSNT
jgi:hypothetical protein